MHGRYIVFLPLLICIGDFLGASRVALDSPASVMRHNLRFTVSDVCAPGSLAHIWRRSECMSCYPVIQGNSSYILLPNETAYLRLGYDAVFHIQISN
jgi:hypothetical protein